MKRGNKSEVFTRFFLSYIVILLIPFLVFSGWVLYIMEGMRESSVRESEYVLNSLRDNVDAQMELLYSDILTLNYNVTINDLLRSPKQEKDIGKLLASRNEIKHLQNGEEVIYVYLPDEDVFLSSKGVYSKLEQMYGKVFAYGDMEYEEFHEKILNGGAQKVFLPETQVLANSKQYSAILYLERIPFGVQTGKSAQVLIFIDTAWIKEEIENYVKEAGRWFGIYTKEKKLIYNTENCPEDMSQFVESYSIEGKDKRNGVKINDSIYTSVQSNFNGWLFVSGIAQKDLYKRVTGIEIILLLLFLVYALVGCGVAYFIAQQNLKPLRKILALRSGEDEIAEGKVNEYQLLESYFQDIISQNQELTESNSGYLEKMKEIWMQNLICGRYNTQEEIEELGLAEISGFERFQVMVIDVAHTSLVMEEESIDKFNARRYQVKMLMKALNMEQMVVAEINMYQLGILFYSNEPQEVFDAQMKEKSGIILEYLKKHMAGEVWLGQGEVVHGALYIGYSFVQAKCAVRACMEYHKDYMAYDEIPRENEKYYFPAQLREMLFDTLQKGNLKQLKSILKILNVENFENRQLSQKQQRQFLEEMYSVMLHLKNKDLITEEELEIREEMSSQDKYYYYVQKILAACMNKTEEVFTEKKKVQQELLAFVDDNYMDSNLCLGMAAEHFHMSESYLSCVFKKNYGVNFSNYLENKRIEHAKLLLLEGKYSIAEVGQMVGYNSPHVFRRAFRKVTGYNPSDQSVKK